MALARSAPDVDAVVLELARDAYAADNPDAWYADALERIARAQAAVTLRDTLRTQVDQASREHIADLRAQAVADLRAPFDRLASQLAKDAAKLPTGPAMFDADAVIEADAAAPLKRTRENLRALALMANVWPVLPAAGNTPPEWEKLAPLVHVPEVTQERVEWVTGVPENGEAIAVALSARHIAADVRRRSLDHVICDIAAGRHSGYRLELADADALAQRRARLHTAFTQRVSKPRLDAED